MGWEPPPFLQLERGRGKALHPPHVLGRNPPPREGQTSDRPEMQELEWQGPPWRRWSDLAWGPSEACQPPCALRAEVPPGKLLTETMAGKGKRASLGGHSRSWSRGGLSGVPFCAPLRLLSGSHPAGQASRGGYRRIVWNSTRVDPWASLKFPAQGGVQVYRWKMWPTAAGISEQARGLGARRTRCPVVLLTTPRFHV